ncbi:MAG: Maf-like protein, partial [Bryobacterales bacterium]|nr:Maf-like protein [Bryobacterales bacterium]
MEIVLGSASPRRAEILRAAGIAFTVQSADVDERRLEGEDAVSYVRRLARLKAEAIQSPGLILTADTTVRVDDHILEKPTGSEDATRMLRLLSGRPHEVLTGVCLRLGNHIVVQHESTHVYFQTLSEQDI